MINPQPQGEGAQDAQAIDPTKPAQKIAGQDTTVARPEKPMTEKDSKEAQKPSLKPDMPPPSRH